MSTIEKQGEKDGAPEINSALQHSASKPTDFNSKTMLPINTQLVVDKMSKHSKMDSKLMTLTLEKPPSDYNDVAASAEPTTLMREEECR